LYSELRGERQATRRAVQSPRLQGFKGEHGRENLVPFPSSLLSFKTGIQADSPGAFRESEHLQKCEKDPKQQVNVQKQLDFAGECAIDAKKYLYCLLRPSYSGSFGSPAEFAGRSSPRWYAQWSGPPSTLRTCCKRSPKGVSQTTCFRHNTWFSPSSSSSRGASCPNHLVSLAARHGHWSQPERSCSSCGRRSLLATLSKARSSRKRVADTR